MAEHNGAPHEDQWVTAKKICQANGSEKRIYVDLGNRADIWHARVALTLEEKRAGQGNAGALQQGRHGSKQRAL